MATKGAKQFAWMTSPERRFTVTVICAISAVGQYVPQRMNEQLLVEAPLGSVGRVSDSGWVDSTFFVDWHHHLAHSVGWTPEEPHILILDGHHSHKSLEAVRTARGQGVILITKSRQCIHKMQLLERTVFNCLKAF